MAAVIEIKGLKKYFDTPKGKLHAVDGVSFKIEKGKTMGVVGESGCGKSTLGRTIIHLLESTGGQILFQGEDVTHAKSEGKYADYIPGPLFLIESKNDGERNDSGTASSFWQIQ